MASDLITVLVVDDSALMRQILTSMLNSDPAITVIGSAPDPMVAREMIKKLNPDVLTLDVEMPKMDGLSFLEKIMSLRPMPVVMVSSLTQTGADVTLQALEMGAVDFVGKPTSDLQAGLHEKQHEIVSKVKIAAKARIQQKTAPTGGTRKPTVARNFGTTEKVILIGASTGGVESLTEVITALPANNPAVMVTQHMPETFTKSFADRLNKTAQVTVVEAQNNQRVLPGHVYIAPGNQHMELAKSGANYICRLHSGEPVSGHRPSVDVLFESAAKAAGANAIGVILTGMGKDGARGLLEMKNSGAKTIGQDEASCVVYGMPRAAFELGAVQLQCSLSKIPDLILDSCTIGKERNIRV
ncbi:MAG: chemotaxis response regulator protein-glutamate methylesterase [Sneathiella sp.]